MQTILNIITGFDFNKNVMIALGCGCFLIVTLFAFFFSNDRKQTSFWRKILDIFVLFFGIMLFSGFVIAGLYFGKMTGIGGYGLIIGLFCFWVIGYLIQKRRARRRDRLINEHVKKAIQRQQDQ